MTCHKCKSDCEKSGSHITQWGETYYLCAFCANIWDNIPTNAWYLFMLNESKDCPVIKDNLTAETYDMLIAREDRAMGRNEKWLKI